MKTKVFTIECAGEPFQNWANLGDDIQSLAAKRLLPQVDGSIEKAELNKTSESGVVSLNGFFLGGAGWPPAGGLIPFFYSFHLSPRSEAAVCSDSGLAYLRQFEPIGCRDRGTMEILCRHGVDAYYSRCISLTFEKRKAAPQEGTVFLVDLSKAAASIVPRRIRKRAVVVEQAKLRLPGLSPQTRELLAEQLLDTYAKRASLVITSKIHCAMPCLAMGIPVVFLYDCSKKGDPRVAIIEDLIGINYVRDSWIFRKLINRIWSRRINWAPEPVDLEEEKKKIRNGYLKAFNRAVERFSEKHPHDEPSSGTDLRKPSVA